MMALRPSVRVVLALLLTVASGTHALQCYFGSGTALGAGSAASMDCNALGIVDKPTCITYEAGDGVSANFMPVYACVADDTCTTTQLSAQAMPGVLRNVVCCTTDNCNVPAGLPSKNQGMGMGMGMGMIPMMPGPLVSGGSPPEGGDSSKPRPPRRQRPQSGEQPQQGGDMGSLMSSLLGGLGSRSGGSMPQQPSDQIPPSGGQGSQGPAGDMGSLLSSLFGGLGSLGGSMPQHPRGQSPPSGSDPTQDQAGGLGGLLSSLFRSLGGATDATDPASGMGMDMGMGMGMFANLLSPVLQCQQELVNTCPAFASLFDFSDANDLEGFKFNITKDIVDAMCHDPSNTCAMAVVEMGKCMKDMMPTVPFMAHVVPDVEETDIASHMAKAEAACNCPVDENLDACWKAAMEL